jgi:predicted ATPase
LEALVVANAPLDGDVRLLAELLSVPFDGRYTALELTPQRKKEKTFEALLRQLTGLAHRQPVLMIVEDLHWADPSSRELLDLTVGRVERLPVLLIASFRPEFQASGTGQPHATALALRRLGREESDALVHSLNGAAALSAEVVVEIVERTDGVPLFVEELTKAVLEAGASGDDEKRTTAAVPATTLPVPATLHASLMARVDRLGPTAKEVAQVGALIGREFSYELIQLAAQRPQPDLEAALDRLTDAGLLGCRAASTYLFKHALLQDAAYGTLLQGKRQELHARVAATLEQHLPDVVERQPELLALHLAAAGQFDSAAAYWLEAGRRSTARSANLEAITHLRRGIEAQRSVAEGSEHARQELAMQLALGPALMATRGHQAPERRPPIRARAGSPSNWAMIERISLPSGDYGSSADLGAERPAGSLSAIRLYAARAKGH